MSQKLVKIYRHSFKGLRPESLNEAELLQSGGLRGDRSFAFQFLDSMPADELKKVDEENAPWMFKSNLANQHDWPELALLEATLNDSEIILRDHKNSSLINYNLSDKKQRQALADYVESFLKNSQAFEKARHPQASALRLVGSLQNNSRYTDGEKGPVSIALCESLQDLENIYGFDVDARRFRINLFLQGASAWEEIKWLGKKLKIGSCLLQLTKPLGRCPNIDVNADTGVREKEIFPTMKEKLGHSLFGVKAEVLEGGMIRCEDTWTLID